MRRIATITLTVALVAIAAAAAPAAFARDDDPTPLSLEPAPLTADTQVVDLHRVVPEVCTPLTDGFCAERVETWICPAGLSADAKARKLIDQPYNRPILTAMLEPVAYLDTHCEFVQLDWITVTGWADVKLGIKPGPPPVEAPVPAFTG